MRVARALATGHQAARAAQHLQQTIDRHTARNHPPSIGARAETIRTLPAAAPERQAWSPVSC